MHNELYVEADVSRLPMHSRKALKKSPNNQLLVGALAHFIFVFLKMHQQRADERKRSDSSASYLFLLTTPSSNYQLPVELNEISIVSHAVTATRQTDLWLHNHRHSSPLSE
jgi:hypothetical protein